jgi:hypothetical protein
MYKINCGIKAIDGIQIEFDDILDFYKYEKERKKRNTCNMMINGYIKSIGQTVLYCDEYKNGMYEWYVVNGKFLNYLEPIMWHPLEDYIDQSI